MTKKMATLKPAHFSGAWTVLSPSSS